MLHPFVRILVHLTHGHSIPNIGTHNFLTIMSHFFDRFLGLRNVLLLPSLMHV